MLQDLGLAYLLFSLVFIKKGGLSNKCIFIIDILYLYTYICIIFKSSNIKVYINLGIHILQQFKKAKI